MMSEHSDLVGRAVRLLRETYVAPDQPWCWPRQELKVKAGPVPDAILVHAEESVRGGIEPEDAVLHAISVCSEGGTLLVVDEDEGASFPFLDEMSGIPANYRWLVVPEEACFDEDTMEMLADECSSRGVGLIACYADEDYDEVYIDPQMFDGQFLTAYSDWDVILGALSEQSADVLDEEDLEDLEEERDYQMSDWDSSGDYD
jgi:hypothetical protein